MYKIIQKKKKNPRGVEGFPFSPSPKKKHIQSPLDMFPCYIIMTSLFEKIKQKSKNKE